MTLPLQVEPFVVQALLGAITPSFIGVSFRIGAGGAVDLFIALSHLEPSDETYLEDILSDLDARLVPSRPVAMKTWVGDWKDIASWQGLGHHLVYSAASPADIAARADPSNR